MNELDIDSAIISAIVEDESRKKNFCEQLIHEIDVEFSKSNHAMHPDIIDKNISLLIEEDGVLPENGSVQKEISDILAMAKKGENGIRKRGRNLFRVLVATAAVFAVLIISSSFIPVDASNTTMLSKTLQFTKNLIVFNGQKSHGTVAQNVALREKLTYFCKKYGFNPLIPDTFPEGASPVMKYLYQAKYETITANFKTSNCIVHYTIRKYQSPSDIGEIVTTPSSIDTYKINSIDFYIKKDASNYTVLFKDENYSYTLATNLPLEKLVAILNTLSKIS